MSILCRRLLYCTVNVSDAVASLNPNSPLPSAYMFRWVPFGAACRAPIPPPPPQETENNSRARGASRRYRALTA